MSRGHDLPSSASTRDDLDPWLRGREGLRRYQPYCITEASSRPESPDSLVPKPLRIDPARRSNVIPTTSDQAVQQVDVNTIHNPSTTTTPNKSYQIATFETGSKSDIRLSTTNREPRPRDTWSVDSNHIAQAVTPRGSHLLASGIKISCDQALSLWMQPIGNVDASPLQVRRRRSLPPTVQRTENGEQIRPLSTVAHRESEIDFIDLGKSQILDEDIESVTIIKQNHSLNTETHASESVPPTTPPCSFDDNGTRFPLQELSSQKNPVTPPQPASLEENCTAQTLELPRIRPTPRSRHLKQNSHATSLHQNHAQFPSLEAAYAPRGLSSETKVGWAHRRTEPKDAKLRYQFGHRTSISLDSPPRIPPHRSLTRDSARDHPTTAPHGDYPTVTHTSHDIQAGGPRPPPWISFEALEAQRRQRGDARERTDAALLRNKKSSISSLHQEPVTDNGTSKAVGALQSEVEDYRLAVLNVYPDMEFKGEAGKSDSDCCCTIM
ncbi:hypothetical protein T440DRAFT_115509 [Plenodomus tracheiphilus IPT5]|uniref:Uncharacterized protein n=1 Tax=Plenodomus tracheiphilus IPT5 TaxID=1408161 RepID=A0A6A7B4C1_9PLEO|nr:hypothetical protein T440DRAFT_115509 [Plenodomus tracheiphilus IPT5]